MPSELNFIVPANIEEALEALSIEGAMLVGGGTSVAILMKNRLIEPTQLVYLGHVAALSGIAVNSAGDLVLGATTTLGELGSSKVVREREPVIASASNQVGNPRVRAVATLGGALAHGDPRQDLPPVLMALGATLHLVGRMGERDVSLDHFFLGLMETELAEDELITSVTVASDATRRVEYSRFTPASEDDFPTVGVAAALSLAANGEVQSARIALGGVGSAVILATAAAACLVGTRPGDEEIASAASAAADVADPSDDQRGSAKYKRAMVEVWTRRTLQRCLDR